MESMESIYVIPVNGLAPGKTDFRWSVGKEFFEKFGNTEITGADLSVRAVAEKSGSHVRIDCDIEGILTVPCDRCLSDLDLHITPHVCLSVKHEGEETAEEDGREVISLAPDDAFLDMSQVIYDYACLSLPMHRVHDEDGCDRSVADHIGIADRDEDRGREEDGSPFAVLKGMF